ncbi:endonuclease domain-containing protein [Mycobacterium sp. SMC-18]|uniref:endonuclease domain-containing protein n=1 Tax=Mycobacteriaceae TaxID=1762 RepID=UPI000EC53466|nr:MULTISPECIES: DUF559 domain-containing protein [unclassified Mycolicibacterium]MDX1881040.1 DUF559 domain-containing protein [Mycolicibacterium sp. 141076]BCI83538.1 hypothetical protein MTY66_51630 [Mycolicibacterium sp. TY66]BCJ78820.1 hypothetical protein MTY81_01930 [Mycolicibacterium sp. TY81]GCA96556.1 hypothetical protein NCCNTM_01910 [Mycolicibacterium sp. NCC-Tsukiji]
MITESDPFIGSEAVASRSLTRYELRRHYRAMLPNIYVDKRIDPSLYQRTQAAWLWSGREATIAGHAAAALHRAKWVPDDAPIELIYANTRPPRNVIARDDLLFDDESQLLGGLPVTTSHRTAFDLGRRGSLVDAVARLDALGAATGFNVDAVREVAGRHRHARGLRQLEQALALYDPGAQSPQESWLRQLLIAEGFPRPKTQIPVTGPDGRAKYFLDMGWEDMRLAVEYDGEQHAGQIGYDIVRSEYIAGVGWTVVRVAAGHRRAEIIAWVNRAWARALYRRNPAVFLPSRDAGRAS